MAVLTWVTRGVTPSAMETATRQSRLPGIGAGN